MTANILNVKQSNDDRISVSVQGAISDKVTLDATAIPPKKIVVLDVSGVIRINSYGVRTWCVFLSDLCDKSKSVHLEGVPPVFVQQANMIRSFFASATIDSFFTPWCCPECESEENILHRVNDTIPETTPCRECKADMEFDDIRDAYLSFAQRK